MFRDRQDAGEKLADVLAGRQYEDPVVLALPRGGVPVAAPVAARLGAPLDLMMVRKIGVPGHEELAAGAVAEGAAPLFNQGILNSIGRGEDDFAEAVVAKRAEITERRQKYLGGRPRVGLTGRTVIVIDDGIATGATARAALLALKPAGAAQVVLAVPVASPDALAELSPLVDEVVCLEKPRDFRAVGIYYRRFDQTSDEEVVAALAGSRS